MGINNLKDLMEERESLLPDEVEFKVMRQASALNHFGDIISLFVLNTMATVVHVVTGGEDPKCLRDKRERLAAEMEEYRWKSPPQPGDDPLPDGYAPRAWMPAPNVAY